MSEPFMAVGLRIKALRGALSLREFAAQLGVDHKSVSGWEAGKRLPDGSSLLALMERFGADVNYILTGQSSQTVSYPTEAAKASLVAEPPTTYATNREEAALLDNYRHSSPEGKAAIEATGRAVAEQAKVMSRPKKPKAA